MSYSFIKIEQDKSILIKWVFIGLILFYFIAAWVAVLILKFLYATAILFWILIAALEDADFNLMGDVFLLYLNHLSLGKIESVLVVCFAVVSGIAHWHLTVNNLVNRLLSILGAEPINPQDSYHQMFQNIVHEVSVATGGWKIEPVVVPTIAMNAFALADYSGRTVVGITEGILARLSRVQIESIVAHEIAHIVTGDCLLKTVIVALFTFEDKYDRGLYGILMEAMSRSFRVFISRQKEYRADAIAVKLTRNPISLAEALYIIDRRWSGVEAKWTNLEAVFIVSPQRNLLDEQEGLWADIFSTHPSIKHRIEILLNLAHSDLKFLEEKFVNRRPTPKSAVPDAENSGINSTSEGEWLVHHEDQWLGPYLLSQIMALDWIHPDTWVKKLGAPSISKAYEDQDIKIWLEHTAKGERSDFECPQCHISLRKIYYEGVTPLKCPSCQGILANRRDITRILVREDIGFSQRIIKMAESLWEEQKKWAARRFDFKTKPVFPCPKCKRPLNKMKKSLFESYPVEVDVCDYCDSIWFDKDEIEVLQYLVEKRTQEES